MHTTFQIAFLLDWVPVPSKGEIYAMRWNFKLKKIWLLEAQFNL